MLVTARPEHQKTEASSVLQQKTKSGGGKLRPLRQGTTNASRKRSNTRLYTIYSDHQNLEHFTSTRTLNSRQARWAEPLSSYNFAIVHCPGKDTMKQTYSRDARTTFSIETQPRSSPNHQSYAWSN